MADSLSLNIISKLQIHYWFSDRTHTMDALVNNKCEREVLEIAKAVAKLCGVSISIETEPSGKGGLKSWLTLAAKSQKKTSAIKIDLVNTLVAASLVTEGFTEAEHFIETLFRNALVDQDPHYSQQPLMQQHIEKLKTEVIVHLPLVEQNGVIKKRKSNFYQLLHNCKKVKGISAGLIDSAKKLITDEQMVARDRFKAFRVSQVSTLTYLVETAMVEIVSPVLVIGKHKWKGMYNGESISFTMKSDEFLTLVQSGKVEFKSGTCMNCRLEIEKKVNSAGIEKVTGYSIVGVNSYSENGKITETPETKQKHKENAVSKKQLDLFG
jgi:hypothetical protein